MNQIKHITMVQVTANKLAIFLKTDKSSHIGDVSNILLCSKLYNFILASYDKMENYTSFSAPILRSPIPNTFKIIHLCIYFCVETKEPPNQYDLHSHTCAYVWKTRYGIDFTVSYSPVATYWNYQVITIF